MVGLGEAVAKRTLSCGEYAVGETTSAYAAGTQLLVIGNQLQLIGCNVQGGSKEVFLPNDLGVRTILTHGLHITAADIDGDELRSTSYARAASGSLNGLKTVYLLKVVA